MRQPIQFIAHRSRTVIAAVSIVLLTNGVNAVGGQPAVTEEGLKKVPASAIEQQTKGEAERRALVAALGASSFAERETAASEIMAAGAPLLQELQAASEASDDPEVRLRASILYRRVAKRDFESRAERFLASETPDELMSGWSAVAPVMGDHQETRELFVEISRAYPELAKAYAGTPRERAIQADRTAEAIVDSLTVDRQSPEPADALALLLVAGDPAVPISLPVERVLVRLANSGSVRGIRTQATLAPVYDDLLSRWIRRSGSEHRQEILWLSMQENLPAGGDLALRTLHETNKPATLQMALQTAARFAEPKQASLIEHLLDDDRPAGDGVAFMTDSGERIETRISDVAMAAIAVMHDKSLEEFGFLYAVEHPNVAFQVESLGFPPADNETRKQVRQRIDKLLTPEQH